MAAGMELLDRWLEDLVRDGLSARLGDVRSTEPASEAALEVAARLVDAQLPGLAARVRRMASLAGRGPAGVVGLLDEVGTLSLISESWRARGSLSEPLRLELDLTLGRTLRREEVAAGGERVTDEWCVVGERVEREEKLLLRRSWLVGRTTGRWALVRDVAIPRVRDFTEALPVGGWLRGELVYYPGAAGQRALLLTKEPISGGVLPRGGVGEIRQRLAEGLGRCPWVTEVAGLLAAARVVDGAEGAWLVDGGAGDGGLPLAGPPPWSLLAALGPAEEGRTVALAVEWDGRSATPLAYVDAHGAHALVGRES
jgi:hypothetical protein